MRRHLPILVLPLLLAACDNNPPAQSSGQPAAEAPAAPATEAPAAEAPASSTPDADTAPLFGSWAVDVPACTSPIVISATSFEGAENTCDITELADNGDGTFTASLACTSQGQSASERIALEPIFGPVGEGVRLTYLDRGGDPVVLFRCRAPATE